LKPQFIKINALQGKNIQTKQSLHESSPVDTRSAIPFDQAQAGPTFSDQKLHRPRADLMSNGMASSFKSPHSNGTPGSIPVTEQETLKQPVTNGLVTSPVHHTNAAQAQLLAYGQFPSSPHQRGTTPFARIDANAQTVQPPQAPLMQISGMQPFPQMSGPNLTSQPLMMPMSMPGPSRSTQSPMSNQQAGGFPPTGQPPRPPGNWKVQQGKMRRFPIWARIVLSVVLLLLILVGSLAAYYLYFLATPVSHIVNQQVTRLKGDEDPNVTRSGTDILSGARVNILLLGSDTDEKFSSGSYLAQSDIIITIDPASRKVGMLSIPRDFWINVPGSGMHKLDEAFALGGVALSRLTIFQDFGIPINYYAWVGLDGFIKVIDTVGGVDVDVLHPITDDTYPDDVGANARDPYAYKRLYIPPGPQHLSGSQALEYVRSRHADLVGDFGRSARQQSVLAALKNKLNNPDIISKLSDIAHDLDGYVKTDMQLTDVFKLMNFARGLDLNSIQRVILGPPYSQLGTTWDGTSVVFPNCALIVPAIAKLFALGNKAACNIQANNANSSVAFASQPSPAHAGNTSASARQMASQVASTNAMSLVGSGDNLLGFHSLLDLMFMVVLESPLAMQA
jgi:LCP family protein required for cell wall assembly